MKKHTLTSIALCGCALALAPMACTDSGTQEPPLQEAPKVQVTHILQQEVTDSKEWFGYVVGQKVTDIQPHVTGVLMEQKYTNGAYVKQGTVLFVIDDSAYKAALALAEAELKVAEADLATYTTARDKAKNDVDTYAPLQGSGAISGKEFNQAKLALKEAEAGIRATEELIVKQKATIARAQIDLSYCTITAPYDGIVSTANTSIGTLVTPATKMANITAVDPVLVRFSVSSDILMQWLRYYGDQRQAEQKHKMPAPRVDLVLEDGSIFPYTGEIVTVGSSVSQNGKVDMEASFDNPDHLLRDGMPVRVRMRVSNKAKASLLVPPSAIRTVLRNQFIIVVDKDDVPHTTPVTVAGEYEVDTPQGKRKMVAVTDFKEPLAKVLKGYGYDKPSDALVVADPENGVQAQNISAANSRLDAGKAKGKVAPVVDSNAPVIPSALAENAKHAAGAKDEENANAKAKFPPVPLKTTKLLRQDVAVNEEWFGTLRGENETDIRPQVSGFLISRDFENGSFVKKGDVLYQIDPAPFQAAVDEAKANLAAARATKDKAVATIEFYEVELQRARNVNAKEKNAISSKEISDMESALATAKATLSKAEGTIDQCAAALQMAEINLGYTTIRAPFDGRVGISTPSVGALVSPGDPLPMVRISSEEPGSPENYMRVDFEVSGKGALEGISAFQELHNRGDETVGPKFDLVLEDGTEYEEKGEVLSADNALSRSKGTLKIVGRVKNTGWLRSGMPVRVRAGMDARKGSYLVPARAPLNAQGMDVLVVLRPDNAPAMLPITKDAIVNIPVMGPDGKEAVQPMQIIDVNRQVMGEIVRYAANNAPSLEAVILGGAGVESWSGLVLKKAGVADFRTLMEAQAKTKLPDDAPAQAGVKDWEELFLKQAGARNFRDLVLAQAHAKDELDLIAQGRGFHNAMEMALDGVGIKDLDSDFVVVEGTIMAAQMYADNTQQKAHVNKATRVPFQYVRPQPVVPSVTAETGPEPENGGKAAPAGPPPTPVAPEPFSTAEQEDNN